MSIPVTRWTAWREVGLPPGVRLHYLDDVPARVMLDLAHRGAAARSTGVRGPPVSLLDQEVIRSARPDVVVGLPMRCVFALTAMGFLPSPQNDQRRRADPGPDIAGVVASGRPSAQFIGIAATRRWCCADGRDASFQDRRHTHSESTALVSHQRPRSYHGIRAQRDSSASSCRALSERTSRNSAGVAGSAVRRLSR